VNRLRLLLITAAGTSGLIMMALRGIVVAPGVASAEAKAEAKGGSGGEAKAEGGGHGGEAKEEEGGEKAVEEGGGTLGFLGLGAKRVRLGPPPWNPDLKDVQGCRPEEIAVLRDLRTRSLSLDAREASLDVRASAMQEAEAQIAQEVKRLEEMRTGLLALVEESKSVGTENTKKLAKVIDQMKAADAADVLSQMDEDTAVDILQLLKARQAGKILGAMEVAKAARLGDRLTTVPDPRPVAAAVGAALTPTATPAVAPNPTAPRPGEP
jgi:flagellar motility protein MotE (MotC chaperone)